MNKNTAFWLMAIGAGVSLLDLATDGGVYGAGKPLEKFKFKVYTSPAAGTTPAKDYYLSISDAAALIGAGMYFL